MNALEQRGLWAQPVRPKHVNMLNRDLIRRHRPVRSKPFRAAVGHNGANNARRTKKRNATKRHRVQQEHHDTNDDIDSIMVLSEAPLDASSPQQLNINAEAVPLTTNVSSRQRPQSATSHRITSTQIPLVQRPQSARSFTKSSARSTKSNVSKKRPQSARSRSGTVPSYMNETSSSATKKRFSTSDITAATIPARPQSARPYSQQQEFSQEDENERFKKTLFAFRRPYVGDPTKIPTTYDKEYYDIAVQPQLQDRAYKHYIVHQRIPSGTRRLFRNDLQPLVRKFLKDGCTPEEKSLFKNFFAKLRNGLPKYEAAAQQPPILSSTMDPTFFDVQQYAYTFLSPEWLYPLRAWFQDESNKEEHQLCKFALSRFSTYYRQTRVGTAYEDQFRIIPVCPRDQNLSKALETVVQERLHDRWLKKHAEKQAALTQEHDGHVKLTHAYTTSYNSHFPIKHTDTFEKYLQAKEDRKRKAAQVEKKPFGTLTQQPYVTSMKEQFPKRTSPVPKGYTERVQRTVEFTASIANRSHPRVDEIQALDETIAVAKELKGVFAPGGEDASKSVLQEPLPYPAQQTHNQKIFGDNSDYLKRMEGKNGNLILYEYLKRNKPTPYDQNFSGKMPEDLMQSETRKSYQGTLL